VRLTAPPLLVAAGLLVWGWFAEHLVPAAVMALLLEATRFHTLRWEVSARDFERIADLCTLAFAGTLVYRFVDSRHFPDSLLTVLVWLPFLFVPLVAAQRYSTTGLVPLSALFWSLRRSGTRHRTALSLDVAYVAMCVLAASAANPRTPWFYVVVCALAGYALWPAKRGERGRWGAALAAAVCVGFALQAGLLQMQARIEEWALEYLSSRWTETDPYRSRTAIGDIGALKSSDRIVLRVDAGERAPPPRLRHAAYDLYANGTWTASARSFRVLPAIGERWPIAPGDGAPLRISLWLTEGRALLALPPGTYRLDGLNVARAERSALGALRVAEGPDLLRFDAWADPRAAVDAPPGRTDLEIPPNLAPVLTRVAAEIGLGQQPPAQAAARIEQFFAERFAYSLTYSRPDGRSRGLGEFLVEDRRGHCEYFATATVMLLRHAGVPARYATGYAVQEYKGIERQYVARARHAHAWALVWLDGRWQELDTTPAVWAAAEEEQTGSAYRPFYDLASALNYWLARWRFAPEEQQPASRAWLWLALPLGAFVAWRVYRQRRVRATGEPHRAPALPVDPRLLPVLEALARQGHVRPAAAPLLDWVRQLPLGDGAVHEALHRFVRDYYRWRFDPAGADPSLEKALSDQAARLQRMLG
jgi:transglutaminase-like putative cysteine protease